MSIFREYFENAYICCLHYVVNKKIHWTERIFWSIAILACLGGTYFVVTRTWYEFREQKPMYKVDIDYLDWSSPYPSVIICEKLGKGITTKQKRGLDKYLEIMHINKSEVGSDLKQKLAELVFFGAGLKTSVLTICNNFKCPKGNYSILVDNFKASCEDMFSYCNYNGELFNCCEEFLPINTSLGKCYSFNNFGGRQPDGSRLQSLKWYMTRKPGKPEGLLYFELKKSAAGIFVTDPSEVPHNQNPTVFYQKQINDLSEYYYRVNVEQTVTFEEERSVPIEARSCRFHEENNLKYFDFYSYSNCMLECYMLAQIEECGCILHTYPVDISEHCQLENLVCASSAQVKGVCDCLPDCNSTTIHKVGTYDRKIESPFLDSSSKISFTLDVPAPHLRYIRYSLKSPLTFVVSVGGAIGFFTGISFQSIAQAFYYFFIRPVADYFIMKKNRKYREKQQKMEENFRIARNRLKLKDVERAIRKDMMEKSEMGE